MPTQKGEGHQIDASLAIKWAKVLQCPTNSKTGGHGITSGNFEERNF